MSAASTPVPRSKSSNDSRAAGPSRHTLFVPLLIFLLGSGTLATYQVMAMEDQLDEVTQAIDKMDGNVKRAQYEKAKFYFIAKSVLKLAPKDPGAEQVVTYFKLRELRAAQPEMFAAGSPSDLAALNPTLTQPTAVTNSAPETPASPPTNSASEAIPASAPAGK